VSSSPSLASQPPAILPAGELKAGADPVLPLTLSLFLIGAGEVIASPMMLEIAGSFGVSSAKVAWWPGIYALAYASLGPLLGPLSDRFGRKLLLVPGLLGLGLTVAATALAPAFWIACFTSALGGACAAAIQPNALAIINDSVDEAHQPRVTGRVFLGLTSSFVIVPVASGLLAAQVGWRLPYFLMSGACFVTAALVARMQVRRAAARVSSGFFSAFEQAFRIPLMPVRFWVSFLWLGICIGLATLLAETLRRRFGLSTDQVGIWTGCFGMAVLAGNLMMDRARRVLGSHWRVLACGAVATVIGAAVVDVLPVSSLYLLIPAGMIWGVGYGMAGPAHHLMVASSAGSVRGTVVGINSSILNSGLMAVTLLAGQVLDQTGVELLVSLMLALQVVGLWLIGRLPRT
jgi:MFS transporter, DHA1 family, inner membrane transport protein